MGIMDWAKSQFIDIIKWEPKAPDQLVWLFPRRDREVKNGAMLLVMPGEAAILIDRGHAADAFTEGQHKLETKNLPVLSTLMGWKYGFESPYKADVLFVSQAKSIGHKWGTRGKINFVDRQLGRPVSVGAFGTYDFRISVIDKFYKGIATSFWPECRTEDVAEQIRSIVSGKVSTVIAQCAKDGMGIFDMDANKDEFALRIKKGLQAELDEYGLEVTKLIVEDVSLPAGVEQAIERGMSVGVMGGMGEYERVQRADAMRDAANNPGGGAGLFVGMGVGAGLGQQIAQPPPLSTAAFFVAIGGQQQGPFQPPALQPYISAGQVTRETLVWRQGMAAWMPAAQVPDLAGLFAAAPPPLPPPLPPK